MSHALLTALCPVVIWIMLVIFFTSICFAIQDGIARLRRLHQIPCSRCAFFTGNYQLRCTVHPYRALSEAAIDCFDYEPLISQPQRRPSFSLGRSKSGKVF